MHVRAILTRCLPLLLLATPAQAQQHDMHDPDHAVQGGGVLPDGWHVRLDRSSASLDQVRAEKQDEGLHLTLGPAGIFYQPERTATGVYELSATFNQLTAPRHPEAYGLFVGGANLDAENQDYLYFLVRHTGEYLIKHRAGTEVHSLFNWTPHEAVRKADAEGKAANTLTIRSEQERVAFLVNGVEVVSMERAPMLNTDGLVGLRVNHNLDVLVTDFTLKK